MGGGKKKQSLKQMTKPKTPKEEKRKEHKASTVLTAEKRSLGLTMPDIENKKVLGELKGMKALTPSGVAARFNIRLSLAKAFLKELERRKMADYVSGGKNLKIYKFTSQ